MIACLLEDMPQAAADDLRKWLARPQLESLKRVAEAKVKDQQAKALRDAVLCAPENFKLDACNLSLRTAQRYQTFIDVLMEFAGQTTPYQIAKLT